MLKTRSSLFIIPNLVIIVRIGLVMEVDGMHGQIIFSPLSMEIHRSCLKEQNELVLKNLYAKVTKNNTIIIIIIIKRP